MIKDRLKSERIDLLVSQSSKNNMSFCGDDYFFLLKDDFFLCVLADGLGSGEFAYESSHSVIEEVKANPDMDVEELMALCNQSLLSKRGAAVSILKVFFETREFIYSSVGNIRFFLYNPEKDQITFPVPVTGYLSGRRQNYRTRSFTFEKGAKFLLHSDGVRLQGAKSILSKKLTLEQMAYQILDDNPITSDDTTLIIGSLFP
ncbi:PP2C family serine/threonine-protein phosphatase [Bacillus massiliglaciei]|uniref:PP2C family serine/threonine-protein phosphatase n=1 Tax=Bacillus massiliglaciei TaxID=1816693 RepID=UPI000AAD03F4|nr:PP2C family serine/threonine-protein phosphatase [Bacillus massiliglaciei]